MNEDTILGSREVSEDEIQGLDARSPVPGRLAQLASALRKPFAGQARSANARYDERFDGPNQSFGTRARSTVAARRADPIVAPSGGGSLSFEQFMDYVLMNVDICSAMTSEYQAMGKITPEASNALLSRLAEIKATTLYRKQQGGG